jgi:uncharacterized protein (TIGR02147 family)
MSETKRDLNIFEYDNYRLFLRDLYESEKARRPGFSFRFFSKQAGFSSPNFLKLVIDGKRNLSVDSIVRFAKALKLNKEESAFFRALVLFNQAATAEERGLWAEEILSFRLYRKLHPLHEAQYAYYARWYNVAIRELMGLKSFQSDPEWIAHTLDPPIGVQQAREAIDALIELGLAHREADGKLGRKDTVLTTGDEVSSSSLMQFHQQMLQKAGEALDRVPGDKRDISAVTVSVSEAKAREIKALIQKTRKEILAIADSDRSPEQVMQVCIQFFPLSKSSERDSK